MHFVLGDYFYCFFIFFFFLFFLFFFYFFFCDFIWKVLLIVVFLTL